MKKILLTGLILLSQGLMATTAPAVQPKFQTKDLPNAALIKQNKTIVTLAAKELSKNLPQKIDDYTQILSITPKGTTMEYLFEINTGAKSDESVRKEDHNRMEKMVTQGICTRSKRFLDAEIGITYIYRSAASKAELFHFDIDKKKCDALMF